MQGGDPRDAPRRVGFLLDRWEPARGGGERAMARLAAHLAGRGHDVRAYAESAAPGAPGAFRPVRTVGATRAARARHLARALPEAAEEDGCDVTVGMRHLERVDLYWPHGGGHLESLRARRESRGARPEPRWLGRHRAYLALEATLLEGGARRVACVSRLVLDELSARFPGARDRLELVPNGVDLERFDPARRAELGRRFRDAHGIPERAVVVSFLAREPRLKGLPQLVEALAPLDAHLVAAGLPEDRRRGWSGVERATVLGEVDAAALLAASDVACLPTWRDACGLFVLEALASGVPVVTTARAGAAEAVTGTAGSVIDHPGDVAALRAELATWLDRARGGAVDRERVRDAVSDRGEGSWLTSLERLVLELAASSRAGGGVSPR